MYVTIGSLDHPERADIVVQYGVESRLPWVKFCEEIPAERTASTAEQQEYLAGMRKNQRTESE
jgi:hypothetical protein